MPLPRRSNSGARPLVASAYRIGDREAEDYTRRQNMPWQPRALEMVRIVPELNFASRFYARMLKHLRIYPSTLDSRVEIKTGLPVEVLDRIQDPGGGRSKLLMSYGRLMFITGEGLLFGRNLNTDMEKWSFVWNGEITIDADGQGRVKKIIHKLGGGQTKEYGPEEAVVYRFWMPSPSLSHEAESPLQAGLEIAEELILLTKSIRATATSRLTNGLLFMPSEISPPPAEPLGDEDPLNDPWSADFIEHTSAQIERPGTAEAAQPLISWVSGDYIEQIRWIQVHDPTNDYLERDLRKEAIDRLAYGMDMPPEALKGLGSTNHWAAMQILGDMWKSHGSTVAQQFCDELSGAYLQPALRDLGYAKWRETIVAYDESRVLMKSDLSEDAKSAATLGFVGGRGYRKMTNIPEDYAPSEEEFKKMMEFKSGGRSEQKPQPQRDPSQDGPPPPGPEGDSGRRTRVVTSSAEAMGAAMMALARCRELAGIRLRQKEKVCPECLAAANGSPHALVASVVGPSSVAKLGLEPLKLVRGGADTLLDMLGQWGYSQTQAQAICELIESFAARSLFDGRQPPLPAGFAAHLERAKEADDAVAGL